MRNDHVPLHYLVSGRWPDPDVRLSADAPLSAHYGLAVARRLSHALDARSMSQRQLADSSTVGRTTIRRILEGMVLPDLGTLARLEAALDIDLYPAGLYREIPPLRTPGTDRNQ
ncbi:helix-turn-helix transcriptional regulator [Actinacidiphila sp. DG2A-62]|uniref:helix-turn-helix domain-containing protein n=1 Tax=Actinacidiphila sp. DG2A-62 TaxID=3108821 RepID=UPI002DBCDEC9|nr:helix-turn-helix transcriptional regulator [Actinacidiphila sp. DG2A-62]MEC3997115.1 helix-turn-helix transcriptional regulator [Actinacidiphila sp. DG2A-62]